MHRLRLLGLNHTTAALDVRERLAVDAARQREAVAAVRETFSPCEAVVLSTCNRVELYISRNDAPPATADLTNFLARFHDVPAEAFAPHLYEKSGRSAVEHLFSVASSLDSLVLGETQILGQVRQAYDDAKATGATGTLLNPLFQRALAVGKQVQGETPLAEGRISVASVAVDYARGIFDHFDDKTIVCVGAGKMTSLAMRHLTALHPGRVVVCNRDPQKAAVLAERFGGESASFDRMQELLVAADIVLTSTGSSQPIITRSQIKTLLRKRRYRPMFIIDLAVPRDVEPSVGELEQVYLYNLDDLQQVVAQTRNQRSGAVDAAKAIVTRNVEEFEVWLRRRELGPAIEQLYSRYHTLARDEVQRALAKMPNVDDAARQQIEEVARRIVNKVLHDPVEALTHGDPSHGQNPAYQHAMEKLFKLAQPNTGPNAVANAQPDSTEKPSA